MGKYSGRPSFEKPVHKRYDFKTKKGVIVPVMEFTLTDMCKYALPSDGIGSFAEKGDSYSASTNKYFPHKVGNAFDCAEVMNEKFKFPQEFRTQAEINAKKLYDAIVELGAPKILRNQTEGRFDPKKSGKLYAELRRTDKPFDINSVRPFQHRQRMNPQRPHVAILAAGGWLEMWSGGDDYIPSVAMAMMSVVWACQAIDCRVTAAMARNLMALKGHSSSLGLLTVCSDDVVPSLSNFGGIFHQDMYRYGITTVWASHKDTYAMLNDVYRDQSVERADSHCPAVTWAREREGATFVIAINDKFSDIKDADLVIKPHEVKDVDKMIDRIAAEIHK